jgi:hypothetical protein
MVQIRHGRLMTVTADDDDGSRAAKYASALADADALFAN